MAILDSGDRTRFESGAVRDMREGKGRCDLAPLEVMAEIIQSPVISLVSEFQKTRDTRHLYLALDQFAIEWYMENEDEYTQTELCASMCLEVAKHFEEGAKKYGPDNWKRGIPVYCYIDSAVRHYLKCVRGDNDEPHARAFVWNLMCCIWEVDYGEDWRKNKEDPNGLS